MSDETQLVDASAIGGIVGGWAVCDRCGHILRVGDWPRCPHGKSVQLHPFAAYWDDGIGAYITSLGDRRAHMRRLHLDYRDKMKPGDLSARLDRINEQKKRAAQA